MPYTNVILIEQRKRLGSILTRRLTEVKRTLGTLIFVIILLSSILECFCQLHLKDRLWVGSTATLREQKAPWALSLQNAVAKLNWVNTWFQAEKWSPYNTPGYKRKAPLTWGCLPWLQSLDSSTGKCTAPVNRKRRASDCGKQITLGTWNDACTIPFNAWSPQSRNAKVLKADSWGMPMESNTEHAGAPRGTTHSLLSRDLFP